MEKDVFKSLTALQSDLGAFRRNYTDLPRCIESHVLPEQMKRIQTQISGFHKPPEQPTMDRRRPRSYTYRARSTGISAHPIKAEIQAERQNRLFQNPNTEYRRSVVQQRYNLPKSCSFTARSVGRIAVQGRLKSAKQSRPRLVPPMWNIHNGTSQIPISEKDISHGMMNLVNWGLIPRDVDIGPAFERGEAPVKIRQVEKFDFKEKFDTSNVVNNTKLCLELETTEQGEQENLSAIRYPSIPSIPDDIPPRVERKADRSLTIENQLAIEAAPSITPVYTLDNLNMHIITLRRGKVQAGSQEFYAFHNQHQELWPRVCELLRKAESYYTQFSVPLVLLDGYRLIELAEDEMLRLTNEHIDSWVMNPNEVTPHLVVTSRKFRGVYGKEKAATVIQSNYRRYKATQNYIQVRRLVRHAQVIKDTYKIWISYKHTLQRIAQNEKLRMENFEELQRKFKMEWSFIRGGKRTEIHIANFPINEHYRNTFDNYASHQNEQIARIFNIRDPNVDIIYVCPIEMEQGITSYYNKILQLCDVRDQNRVRFIFPSFSTRVRANFSTSASLYFSFDTLAQLKKMIKGQTAYIITGATDVFDVRLAHYLQVPIMGNSPQLTKKYCNKSGCKELFAEAGLQMPTYRANLYTEAELIEALTELIMNDLNVDNWLIKINDEVGSRGHAYINVNKINVINEIKNTGIFCKFQHEDMQSSIRNVLAKAIPKIAIFVVPTLYSSWEDYVAKLEKVGCIVESVPYSKHNDNESLYVSFMLEPDGTCQFIGAFSKIKSRAYMTCGFIYPQRAIPMRTLLKTCHSFGRLLKGKGMMGYVNLEWVTYQDARIDAHVPQFIAVDLELHLTSQIATFFMYDFMLEGELDVMSGSYYITASGDDLDEAVYLEKSLNLDSNVVARQIVRHNTLREIYTEIPESPSRFSPRKQVTKRFDDFNLYEMRQFVFIGPQKMVNLKNMEYSDFFQAARAGQQYFDLEKGKGVAFLPYDKPESQLLGLLVVGYDRAEILSMMLETLVFVQRTIGSDKIPTLTYHKKPRDVRYLEETINATRKLDKRAKLERKSFFVEII